MATIENATDGIMTAPANTRGTAGQVLQVRVMDWITDSSSEQQSHVETARSFSDTRHLEIRLTGWTHAVNQQRRIHVGMNTVPVILVNMIRSAITSVHELTIDLECLASSQQATLNTFCNLVTAPNYSMSLSRLTIMCSGEEDISSHTLRHLGRALKNLTSVATLRLSGMNPDHLAISLNHMKAEVSCLDECCLELTCCPRKGADNGRPCPRIVPNSCCDPYQAVPSREEATSPSDRNPKKLEILQVRLSHKAIAHLVHLLLDESQSSISNLVLRDCIQSAEDLDFVVFLCKGHSVLKELTLDRHCIRSFRSDTHPWWNPCTRMPSPTVTNRYRRRRLQTMRLLDCQGARKVLEQVTQSLVLEGSNCLQRLVLQYTSMETCSMTIHALNALYLATVIHNKPSHLLELQVVAVSPHPESSYRLHQLAAFLGHPLCSLQSLRLHLGTSPYHLDILGDRLTDNDSLSSLVLSGDDPLSTAALDGFVSLLEHVPKLTRLELDFPGIDPQDEQVLRIFHDNTTLEDIRILQQPDDNQSSNPLCFTGLRNRIRKVLAAHQSYQVGRSSTLWKEILQLVLTWYQSNGHCISNQNRELVFASGIWFALTESPVLVADIEGPWLMLQG